MVERLRQAQAAPADPRQPLLGWGFDPICFGGRRCVREDLDRVSAERPVGLVHASVHILNAYSTALARCAC